MDTLKLIWKMTGCLAGVDDSTDNPLARATDRLFRLGRPFSRLSKCFFLGSDGVCRWLGIFVHSAGDRLLFFPGFAHPQSHVVAYNENTLRWDQPFQIDHLSLEPDKTTWHITSPQSADHLGDINTHQLASDRTYWFSMSVATQESLRIAREETHVVAPTPPQDADRRVEVFRLAREGAVFQLVELNTQHAPPVEPTFLHFSVVVGPKGFSSPENELLGGPHGGPFLTAPSPDWQGEAPIRLHRVLVSDSIELEITASVLPGKLPIPMLFSSPLPASQSSARRTQA